MFDFEFWNENKNKKKKQQKCIKEKRLPFTLSQCPRSNYPQ